jgi:hypothetical protein
MKFLPLILIASIILFGSRYDGSSISAVTLVGGIIKSTHIELPDQKYKRKNCPVCKGSGKYLSGDGIKMVDCGYCEPEKNKGQVEQPKTVIHHPPIILKSVPKCSGPNCRITQ